MSLVNIKDLLAFVTRPAFLLLDLAGLIAFTLSTWDKLDIYQPAILTVGSTILTIGISLPIALYFQSKHNSESFKIIRSCQSAGIKSIFVSRRNDINDLRDSLADAASTTKTGAFFLGIAFKSLFDPNHPHTKEITNLIDDPNINIRLLILDPASAAASERSKIEQGNTTIDDIKYTIDNGIPYCIRTRLSKVLKDKTELCAKWKIPRERTNLAKDIAKYVNIEVRLYQHVPIMFIMGFRNYLFTEQYHLGRPDELVRYGSCIGKYVPVIQYHYKSAGYRFLTEHFEYVWENSKNITDSIYNDLIKKENIMDVECENLMGRVK